MPRRFGSITNTTPPISGSGGPSPIRPPGSTNMTPLARLLQVANTGQMERQWPVNSLSMGLMT